MPFIKAIGIPSFRSSGTKFISFGIGYTHAKPTHPYLKEKGHQENLRRWTCQRAPIFWSNPMDRVDEEPMETEEPAA
jgi:hypothetical protein